MSPFTLQSLTGPGEPQPTVEARECPLCVKASTVAACCHFNDDTTRLHHPMTEADALWFVCGPTPLGLNGAHPCMLTVVVYRDDEAGARTEFARRCDAMLGRDPE